MHTERVTDNHALSWALQVNLHTEFEECLDFSWTVVPAANPGHAGPGSSPRIVRSSVELVLDRSSLKASSKKPLEPAKDAMVKRIQYQSETEAVIQNMPMGRRFLVAIVSTLSDTTQVRSPWVRARTLSSDTRDPMLANNDPTGMPRLNCKACPCTGYVPFPGWSWNSVSKLRCRRCSCDNIAHVACDIDLILRAREQQFQERFGLDKLTPLPNEAVPWNENECMLWLLTGGAFHPRRAHATRQNASNAGVQEATGVPLMAGRAGLVSVLCVTMESRSKFHRALWRCFDAQLWSEKELIVVDTYQHYPSAYFTKLAKQDSRVIYLSFKCPESQDFSIGLKRNLGIHIAKGEFIAHFDDDDLYASNYLSTMIAELEKNRAEAITLSSWYVHNVQNKLWGFCDVFVWGWQHGKPMWSPTIKSWAYGYGFSYVYRRTCAVQSTYENVNMGEDFKFMQSLMQVNGDKAVVLFRDQFGICIHMQHGHNTSNCFPIRSASMQEVLRLDVADLLVELSVTPGSASPAMGDRFYELEAFARHENLRVHCSKGVTTQGFLDDLEQQHQGRGLDCGLENDLEKNVEVYCVSPASEHNASMRNEEAAAICGVSITKVKDDPDMHKWIEFADDVNIVDDAAADHADQRRKDAEFEFKQFLERAKAPLKLDERISLHAKDLWLLPPSTGAPVGSPSQWQEHGSMSLKPQQTRLVSITCQSAQNKKLVGIEGAVILRVPVDASVRTFRWYMAENLPEQAKVMATMQEKKSTCLAQLHDDDVLPDKVVVTEYNGHMRYLARFNLAECREAFAIMKSYFSKPESQKIMDDCERHENTGMLLASFLARDVYPAIRSSMGLLGDETGGVYVIMEALWMTAARFNQAREEPELLEVEAIIQEWHDVECLMRNKTGIGTALFFQEQVQKRLQELRGKDGNAHLVGLTSSPHPTSAFNDEHWKKLMRTDLKTHLKTLRREIAATR